MTLNPKALFSTATLFVLIIAGVPGSDQEVPEDGPDLVLVLSGGGARGAAHIGVLRALEEMKIVPDMIVGTSMGSIVGGLYAAGWSPDEIENLLVSIDWNSVFTDKVPRNDLSYRRKQDDRPFLINVRMHFDEDGFYLPPGVLTGQSMEILLQTLEAQSRPERDFDRLPVPFRAVATDLKTAEPVVFDSGSLATAMRASMSIPGLFPPVIEDGRTLVDGGSVANLPVGIAQSLGAKTIIAVDISSRLTTADEKLKNFFDIYNKLNAILTVNNRREDVARLHDGDVLIQPDLGDINFLAFDRAAETVAIGEAAARESSDKLQSLAATPDKWERYLKRQRRSPTETIHVDRVRLVESGLVKESVAQNALHISPPVDLAPEDLRRDIMRLFHLRHSGIISFHVDEIDGIRELVIDAPPPPYGRHSFQLGLGLFDDFDGNGEYSLAVRHQMLPANKSDGEWQNFLEIGSRARFISEFYQPLGPRLQWFVEPLINFIRQRQQIWVDASPVATYQFEKSEFRFSGGRVLGNHSQLKLGAFFSDNSLRKKVGDPLFPNFQEDRAGFDLSYLRDTESSVYFPRHGGRVVARATKTLEAMGSDAEMEQFFLSASNAWSFGEYTILPHVEYGESRQPAGNFADFFFLGGPGRLSGLGFNELYGDTLVFGRLQGYRRLKKIDMAGISVRLYAGLTLEAGNTFFYDQPVSVNDFRYGGSLFIGAETPIGPVFLGYGHTDGDRNKWYLAIGDIF